MKKTCVIYQYPIDQIFPIAVNTDVVGFENSDFNEHDDVSIHLYRHLIQVRDIRKTDFIIAIQRQIDVDEQGMVSIPQSKAKYSIKKNNSNVLVAEVSWEE
jgi:hypothetical protein